MRVAPALDEMPARGGPPSKGEPASSQSELTEGQQLAVVNLQAMQRGKVERAKTGIAVAGGSADVSYSNVEVGEGGGTAEAGEAKVSDGEMATAVVYPDISARVGLGMAEAMEGTHDVDETIQVVVKLRYEETGDGDELEASVLVTEA
jgi:hypothetical protein